ncbi:glycosyltransferase family 2 protein [Limnofasciculus baicalensis]|uniref:Glycosyltransferase n=1 Tax=Limnofasciculus baicalensis BBK-W-15 TaxID=2699891 RepID=A0AAE3GN60_9CYAN|nr:glycosyltransferase [Limnofasciculus baicalensis]MCP2727685.1 glycosyltransferase [Limnofasciculus baicalensis BBK-W-15]
MTEPLVSIIMPAYKAEKLIPEALACVKAQTYKNWELIVVEDASNDATEAIVNEFVIEVGEDRVQYIRHEYNQGVSGVRNTAINQAKGEYLAFLDYDDLWKAYHLETAVNTLQKTGGDIVYSTVEMFQDGTDKIIGIWGPSQKDVDEFPASLLGRNYIASNVVVMKSSIPEKVGYFEINLKAAEDLDYWLRIAEAGFKFVYIPGVYGSYRKKQSSSLTSQAAMVAEYHAMVIRKHWYSPILSQKTRQEAALLYHLKAAKFNLKNNPLKAAEFLLWIMVLNPQGFLLKLFNLLKGK